MWRKRSSALFAVLFCVALSAQTPGAPPREIENVAAFARLYGVLRFFYPSDHAAGLDWNRFAIDGVARVRTASNSAALELRLRELVADLGPGIEIGSTLTPYRQPAPSTDLLVACATSAQDRPMLSVPVRTRRSEPTVSARWPR